jgi:hypothetical protein
VRSGDIADHDHHHRCSVTSDHRGSLADRAGAYHDHNPRRPHDHNVTGADDLNNIRGFDNDVFTG